MSAIPAAIRSNDPLFAERFRAMSSRDSRFDGQFITGVHSTGIYCRPSCPAMTPKPGNVTFYRTAAAAHEAGLRACKRCLPDAVPGSSDWNIHDDLAARAMRLIADGVVERDGVPGLAGRLGYTPRHLTRVLVQELGAGPLALARAHRAQTARTLLTSTELSIADVAFAAGFSSIRQFNDTVLAVYETTPSELRRVGMARSGRSSGSGSSGSGSSGSGTSSAPRVGGAEHDTVGSLIGSAGSGADHDVVGSRATTITLRLPARAPFDGRGLMTFFADHAVAGIESGDASSYRRAVRLPHGIATVELSLEGASVIGTSQRGTSGISLGDASPGGGAVGSAAAVLCTARLDNVADLGTLVSRVRRLLDLDADSEAIDASLSRDPDLAPLVTARPGVRLPGSLDPEEALFRTLIGQQISVAAARTVIGRLTREVGELVEFGELGRLTAVAGTGSRTSPAGVAGTALAEGSISGAGTGSGTASTDQWGLFPTAAQLLEYGPTVLRGPASRVRTVLGVAEALISGSLRLDVGMPVEELTASLVALPGVGPWTAGYLAMRVLGNPDVLLSTDLVILKSAASLGLPATARGLAEHGQHWAPWRSYAGLHLWRAAHAARDIPLS